MLKFMALSLALLSFTVQAELVCEIDTDNPGKKKGNYERHLYIGPVHNDEIFVFTPQGRLLRESVLFKMSDAEIKALDQSLYIQISNDGGKNMIDLFTMDHAQADAPSEGLRQEAAAITTSKAKLHLYVLNKSIGITCVPR